MWPFKPKAQVPEREKDLLPDEFDRVEEAVRHIYRLCCCGESQMKGVFAGEWGYIRCIREQPKDADKERMQDRKQEVLDALNAYRKEVERVWPSDFAEYYAENERVSKDREHLERLKRLGLVRD